MSENQRKRKATESIEFYVGLLLLAAGLFFILNKTIVSSGFGFYNWTIGGFRVSSGLVVIPLIAGIVWLFYNPKSIMAKILSVLGGIFIIASIIMNLNIRFTTTSMFDYIIMLVLMASGSGLLLKSFFKKSE